MACEGAGDAATSGNALRSSNHAASSCWERRQLLAGAAGQWPQLGEVRSAKANLVHDRTAPRPARAWRARAAGASCGAIALDIFGCRREPMRRGLEQDLWQRGLQ